MHKKYIPLLIGVALAIGFWMGGLFSFGNTKSLLSQSAKKQKLNKLIDYIEYEYVDDVNTDSIVDVTVNRILENLDPHSVYIPEKKLQEVTESMNGGFVGIGVSFYMRKDTLSIIKTIEGGPSKKAGLQAGDKILMANKDTLFGKKLSNDEIIKALRGKINSEVKLSIYRNSEDKQFIATITRDIVPLKSVTVFCKVADSLGYIKINRFAETTYKEFKKALDELIKEGITSLVLDLRGNPGGFLDRANQIVDEFLEDGKLILFTKNKKGNIEKFFATEKGSFEKGKIFVLIDEDSASASEIVAGALQDNDHGIIVGRRSFGKGLVQKEMQLGDGSAVRLTVSRYYTPTGRSIQKPYKNKTDRDYYNEYTKRYISGELTDSTQIKVADSLKFTTPKGKVVYGGGGIIPDVFVPITASFEYDKVNYAINTPLIDNFIFDFLEKDRNYFKEVKVDSFCANYTVSDTLLENYKKHLKKRTRGELNISNATKYHSEIKTALKAAIAAQLFNDNVAYSIKAIDDKMLQKVKELLKK